ncbi:hypothetical protein [Saccharothrix sp. Mg75]|uniref:hypothetical protein n=1 Tax=Saccharothrix sp. Mg75 TaxID=3445357 RepID=UPI003EEE1FD2
MTTRSAGRRTRRRGGIVGYLGTVVDATKDYVDEVLDRGEDIDHDLRDTARRVIGEHDEGAPDAAEDIADLRAKLEDLAREVGRLGGGRSSQGKEKAAS